MNSQFGRFQLQETVSFSATRYAVFQQCKRHFFYRYLLGRSIVHDTTAEAIQVQWQEGKIEENRYRFWLWEVMKLSRGIFCTLQQYTQTQIEDKIYLQLKRMHLLPIEHLNIYFELLLKEDWFAHLLFLKENQNQILNRPAIDHIEYQNQIFTAGMPLITINEGILSATRLAGRMQGDSWISDIIALLIAQMHTKEKITEFRFGKLHLVGTQCVWSHQRYLLSEYQQRLNELLDLSKGFDFKIGSYLHFDYFLSSSGEHCYFCPYRKHLCSN